MLIASIAILYKNQNGLEYNFIFTFLFIVVQSSKKVKKLNNILFDIIKLKIIVI
jgi:hypothetical protein